MATPTILQTIVDRKHEEVASSRSQCALGELEKKIQDASPCRGFVAAIGASLNAGRPAVIAEIKKASPSKGVIREDFPPATIAASYAAAGASCLSVLTDVDFFQGHNRYLQEARAAVAIPVLRKDFIVDEYQIYEARSIGADCILLIAACLSQADMLCFNDCARQLGMDVLVEVHNEEELLRALELDNRLIGINNRDLHSFDTRLETTTNLLAQIPGDRIVVTESGIHTIDDVALMQRHDVNAFLVGEAFMRQPDPGAALSSLFF